MTDQFEFLKAEWPDVHEAAVKVAEAALHDPRTACFYARRALELAVTWAFKFDASLRAPYQDNLSALLHEPSFKRIAGPVFYKARLIKELGNDAAHRTRRITPQDSVGAVRDLFHFCYWFARSYARGARPSPSLVFDAAALPKTSPVPKQTVEQLQQLQAANEAKDEKLSVLFAETTGCGTTSRTRRAKSTASTRRTSWRCSSSAAPRAAHSPPPPSTRPSSTAITRCARSGASARPSSTIEIARRWS